MSTSCECGITSSKNNSDEIGDYERSEIIYDYTEYVNSLSTDSCFVREFEYAGQYISYNGKTVEEDVFDESVTLSRGEYCLIYTTTLNKPVMYTVKPASPDDTGYIDIESIINEEYDTWSALEKRLSNRVEKAEEDLTTASDYFKEGYNSANAPSDAEEAFDAWSDYVSGSFIPIINYTPVILICGFAFFFSVMVLSVVFNAVYAVGDKDLRNRTFAVRDKLVLVKGEKAGEEFIGTLKKYSKKRDAEGFFVCVSETETECDAAISALPYKTADDAKAYVGETVMRCAVLDGAAAGKALRAELGRLWKNRDHAALVGTCGGYETRYKEHCDSVADARGEGSACDLEYEGKSKFDGRLIQKIGWDILCFIVKWITLTIAKPATECWKQRWYTKHTVIDGRRLSFDGNGLQLFGKRTLNLLLTIVTFGIYGLFSKFNMDKWIAKHTHIAGETGAYKGTFDGKSAIWTLLRFGCFLLKICTLYIMSPFTECWKQAWYAKHCVYDGRRMKFDGNGAQLIGKWMLWWLLSIVTLGVYSFFAKFNVKKWVTKHTHIREGYVIAK